MSQRYRINILDALGNPTGTAGGVAVVGPLLNTRNVKYVPQGGKLDAVPTFSFDVPLAEWRNLAAAVGTQLQLVDQDLLDAATGLPAEVARGPLNAKSESIAADGHWASITCDDLLHELVRASTTRGFASIPGEATQSILTRMAKLQPDAVWTAQNVDLGTAFDGIPFVVYAKSLLQGYADLAVQDFAHFKRGVGRTLLFGSFGTPSGLVFVAPQPNATATATDNNAIYRQIETLSYKTDGHLVNALTPTGAGNGDTELTLQSLYTTAGETQITQTVWRSGAASFAGAVPAYPIYKRLNYAGIGGAVDYYLEDAASVTAHGRWHDFLRKTEIGPVKSVTGGVTTVDEQDAARALYTVTVAALKGSAKPKQELSITTTGIGDIRNLAGQTVRVRYNDIAENITDPTQPIITTLNIDADYVVMGVERSEGADEAQTDSWTLTTNGQYLATTASLVLGAVAMVEAGHSAIQTYPATIPYSTADNGGPGFPVGLTVFGGNYIVRRHEITAIITPGTLRVAAKPKNHTHTIPALTVPIPALVVAIPALPVVIPSVAVPIPPLTVTIPPLTATVPGQSITVPGQSITVPGQTITIPSLSVTGSAQLVVQSIGATTGTTAVTAKLVNSSVILFTTAGNNGNAPLSGMPTATGTSTTTVASQVSTVAASVATVAQKIVTTAQQTATNATTASSTATTSTTSGTTASTTATTASSTASVTGASGLEYGATNDMNGGGTPTGLTLWVDNTQVAGPWDTPPPVDLLPFIGDFNNHRVEVRIAGSAGHIELQILIRQDITTLAVGTLG